MWLTCSQHAADKSRDHSVFHILLELASCVILQQFVPYLSASVMGLAGWPIKRCYTKCPLLLPLPYMELAVLETCPQPAADLFATCHGQVRDMLQTSWQTASSNGMIPIYSQCVLLNSSI